MNPQHAVFVTLLVASVSGVAIWQRDAAAAAKAPPAAAVAPSAMTGSPSVRRAAWSRWLDAALDCWQARELTLDVRRGESSLTLQLSWRRAPAVADRAVADGSR